jgi:subtilisin family serine protease
MKGKSREDKYGRQTDDTESGSSDQTEDYGDSAAEGSGEASEGSQNDLQVEPIDPVDEDQDGDSSPDENEKEEPADDVDQGGQDGNGGNGGDDEPDQNAKPSRRSPIIVVAIIFVVLFLLYILASIFRVDLPGVEAYPPEEFFVQDQIIVSGPADLVIAATAPLSGTEIVQTEILRFNDIIGGSECPGLSIGPRTDRDLVIALFQIIGDGPDVAQLIEEIGATDGVTAEPNWVSGTPYEVEGSPYEVEGSPYEVEGSGQKITAVIASNEDFDSQAAWSMNGIQLAPIIKSPTGAGVQVAIFDASPFDAQADATTVSQLVAQQDALAHMDLTPHYLEQVAKVEKGKDDKGIDLSSHGLFVAGLVHKVAGDSRLELFRVIEDDNRGNLFLLNKAIFNFIAQPVDEGTIGRIINASLVIRIPREEATELAALPQEILSLQDILTAARCLGIVTVAAAGNQSANVTPPHLAGLPADWSSVIGVAASNMAGERSCFSNQGDVAALGGDGQDPGTHDRCRPLNHTCNGPDCPYAVIGPVLDKPTGNISYTYWSGSSFAAPMVSGLAALVLEEANGNLTPTEVRAIIECGASKTPDRHLGEGVISVKRTIEQCMRPAVLQAE